MHLSVLNNAICTYWIIIIYATFILTVGYPDQNVNKLILLHISRYTRNIHFYYISQFNYKKGQLIENILVRFNFFVICPLVYEVLFSTCYSWISATKSHQLRRWPNFSEYILEIKVYSSLRLLFPHSVTCSIWSCTFLIIWNSGGPNPLRMSATRIHCALCKQRTGTRLYNKQFG